MLRCCELRWPRLAAGTSVLRWPVRVPFLSAFSRQLRGCWGSTDDSKADGGDGLGDFRGESFERPVFAGARGENVARCRSCGAAKLGPGERCAAGWRGHDSGGNAKAAWWARSWRPELGGGPELEGAERAQLAKAAKGGRPAAVHRNGGGARKIPERYGGGPDFKTVKWAAGGGGFGGGGTLSSQSAELLGAAGGGEEEAAGRRRRGGGGEAAGGARCGFGGIGRAAFKKQQQ
jgi:hypothetical protein